MRAFIVSLCAMVLLAGCVNRGNLRVERAGESIDIFHNGKDIEQIHTVDARWGRQGRTASTECKPSQLSHDDFWGIPTCPSKYDQHATLGVDVARTQTASYKDLVIPAVISGLFQVASFGTFAAVMPRTDVNVRQTGATTNEYFSTKCTAKCF